MNWKWGMMGIVFLIVVVIYLIQGSGDPIIKQEHQNLTTNPDQPRRDTIVSLPCYNGEQDPGETGIDCGGTCNEFCQYPYSAGSCEGVFASTNKPNSNRYNIITIGTGFDSMENFRASVLQAFGANPFTTPGKDVNNLAVFKLLFNQAPTDTIFAPYQNKLNFWYHIGGNIVPGQKYCSDTCPATPQCSLANTRLIVFCKAECEPVLEFGKTLWVPAEKFDMLQEQLSIGWKGLFSPSLTETEEWMKKSFKKVTDEDAPTYTIMELTLDNSLELVDVGIKHGQMPENRNLASPYLIRVYTGRVSYVFDFSDVKTFAYGDLNAPEIKTENYTKIVIRDPIKGTEFADNGRKLRLPNGDVLPYTLQIFDDSGIIIKEISSEKVYQLLRAKNLNS